jgi:hypothetical protein
MARGVHFAVNRGEVQDRSAPGFPGPRVFGWQLRKPDRHRGKEIGRQQPARKSRGHCLQGDQLGAGRAARRPLGHHRPAQLVGEERPALTLKKPHPALPLQPFRAGKGALHKRGARALVGGKPQPPQTRRQCLAGRSSPPSQTQRRAESGPYTRLRSP